jgi:hypothetical protein
MSSNGCVNVKHYLYLDAEMSAVFATNKAIHTPPHLSLFSASLVGPALDDGGHLYTMCTVAFPCSKQGDTDPNSTLQWAIW